MKWWRRYRQRRGLRTLGREARRLGPAQRSTVTAMVLPSATPTEHPECGPSDAEMERLWALVMFDEEAGWP